MRLLPLTAVALLITAAACDPSITEGAAGPAPGGERLPATPGNRPATQAVARWPDDTFVVWARGGLGPRTIARLRRIEGIQGSAVVTGGLIWLTGESVGGRFTDHRDLPIPMDVAFVDRRDFRSIAPPSIEEAVVEAWRGELGVLSDTGATLRGSTGRVGVVTDTFRYAFAQGTVPDEVTFGFEALFAERPRPGWGRAFLLVRFTGPKHKLKTDVERIVPTAVRVRRSGEARFLRHADAVEPLMLFKKRFGEFAARPVGGRLEIDPAWVARNIVDANVPLLGNVTCHRITVRMVTSAMESLQRSGYGGLIDTDGFAGCYDPRFIASDPSAPISAHAFGAAVDINAPDNAQGTRGNMPRVVVEAMREAGFTWGGRWLLTDPMHFEWALDP